MSSRPLSVPLRGLDCLPALALPSVGTPATPWTQFYPQASDSGGLRPPGTHIPPGPPEGMKTERTLGWGGPSRRWHPGQEEQGEADLPDAQSFLPLRMRLTMAGPSPQGLAARRWGWPEVLQPGRLRRMLGWGGQDALTPKHRL